ncbi:MAG: BREX system P-loop protein BrxC [Acidobacteria bacterium]|nr:BREX system P-loop protein BrxC [Acidobacteriota bacterium]
MYGLPWRRVRKGHEKFDRTSALLHQLDATTYPSARTWFETVQHSRRVRRMTVGDIVKSCFDLCAIRRPGKAFAFIVDEMGQYVARGGERLENLRAVVEQFGKESLERQRLKQIPGPAWIIVTAQEKLQDVYNYLATGRIDLPKLQDRFKHQIDLSPADIRQVATQRVLRKKEAQKSVLKKLFQTSGPNLIQHVKLEFSARRTDFDEEQFVQFYPYLPHLIDLSIDIMTGIRSQANAPKHLGGSNRTIIKQSFEMLVSDRTRLKDQPVGALVSIDKIYELVEGNIPSEKQKDILDVRQSFDSDAHYPGLASRVAKALCLMEFAKTDLRRTIKNIAALLVQQVTEAPQTISVKAILDRLKEAQFVRETDDGWKLQTAQEKSWEDEKNGFAGLISRNDRAEILRNAVKEVFDSANAVKINYRSLRSFDLALSVDGQNLPVPGKAARIPLQLYSVHGAEDIEKQCAAISTESLQTGNKDGIHWVFKINRETDTTLVDLHASRRMIAKYDHASAQQQFGHDKSLLETERSQWDRHKAQLVHSLEKNLIDGVGFFRGLRYAAGDLGHDLPAMMRGLAERAIPDLYPRLEMGSRNVSSEDPEEFLKQANLSNLPPLFHAGEKGLGLVTKEGSRFVPNPKAEIAQEILTYLKREDSYGEKVTGAKLVEAFGGLGYGWSAEIVRLVVAVLFRAGAVEVTHQARRHRNYQDPQARAPFASNPAFRAASFSPRESIDLKTLGKAVQELEAMLGREVDVEESAIAEEFQKLARNEREQALPALEKAKAYGLPVVQPLAEWVESLQVAASSQSDDCVRMLAGEGKSLRAQRDKAQRIFRFLEDENIETVRQARVVVREQIPMLARSTGKNTEEAESVSAALSDPELPSRINEVAQAAANVDIAYRARYAQRHQQRFSAYRDAVESIQANIGYRALDATVAEPVLAALARRTVATFELPPFAAADRESGATLATLEDDLELLPSLQAGALGRLSELGSAKRETEEAVEVIRLGDFLPKSQALSDFTDAEIDEALEKLKQKLYALRELKRRALWD